MTGEPSAGQSPGPFGNHPQPATFGLLAQATSLRLALALLVLTSLATAGLATRWPPIRSRQVTIG